MISLEPILSKIRDERKPRHRLAPLSNPERKNTPCISDLTGVKFLLEKERVFFFRGSTLNYSGSRRGEMPFSLILFS